MAKRIPERFRAGPPPVYPPFTGALGDVIVPRGATTGFFSTPYLPDQAAVVDLTTAVIRGGSASDIANGRRLGIVGVAGPGALRVTEATILP